MPRQGGDTDQVQRAMLATPLLEGVPNGAVGKLASAGRVRLYRKGTYLCHQGDPADEIYFLLEGRVEISSTSVTGSRVLHATVDMPQFVGELGVLAEIDRTASVLTLEDSQVWIAAADGCPGSWGVRHRRRGACCGCFRRQVHSHEAAWTSPLPRSRGSGSEASPPDGDAVARRPSRRQQGGPRRRAADLASLCGGSRVTVTRILSEFQRRGCWSAMGSATCSRRSTVWRRSPGTSARLQT